MGILKDDETIWVIQFEMMDKDEFKQALDIWAQFFIAPLMKKDTVSREINAVDSEFDIAKQNDWCRKLFVTQVI